MFEDRLFERAGASIGSRRSQRRRKLHRARFNATRITEAHSIFGASQREL
jgi:hypothetical protein